MDTIKYISYFEYRYNNKSILRSIYFRMASGNSVTNLYLCGLACTAKSTTLRAISQEHKINVIYGDYFEQSQLHPEFLNKHKDPSIQIIYTIQQTYKSTINTHSIFDRSPISDFLYSLIFDEQAQPGAGIAKLKSKLKWKLFNEICMSYKTLYIILEDEDIHARHDILKKMSNRNNGLDDITEDYIVAQQKIFKLISNEISNYKALIKPKQIIIHTQEYYKWLKEGVENFLRENYLLK